MTEDTPFTLDMPLLGYIHTIRQRRRPSLRFPGAILNNLLHQLFFLR